MAAVLVALALSGATACGDEEDDPQGDNTGEKIDTPTSVEDTRTTLGGG